MCSKVQPDEVQELCHPEKVADTLRLEERKERRSINTLARYWYGVSDADYYDDENS